MITLIARSGMVMGVLLALLGGLSAWYHPAGSAEFTLSAATCGLGVFLLIVCVISILIERKRQ
ncbi:hypothetical protein [Salininema proteolyticum]|uniref:Uncharacterized protein n=1 Tax=Salininema proteolyticum TaxID=1607685 RepID=A0ABV8U2N6_9ACTN